jgi:hypothetical protein
MYDDVLAVAPLDVEELAVVQLRHQPSPFRSMAAAKRPAPNAAAK